MQILPVVMTHIGFDVIMSAESRLHPPPPLGSIPTTCRKRDAGTFGELEHGKCLGLSLGHDHRTGRLLAANGSLLVGP